MICFDSTLHQSSDFCLTLDLSSIIFPNTLIIIMDFSFSMKLQTQFFTVVQGVIVNFIRLPAVLACTVDSTYLHHT